MKLDIVVTHYREPWEICRYLFDSIALQRGVPLDQIRVLVINDGDSLLDEKAFTEYPFAVEYKAFQHGGISAARNHGIECSTAEYVMFCDIDDGFLNNYGLHLIFSAMQEGFDFLCSNFVEETFTEHGDMTIIRHDRDMTFMHGKVYRLEFLEKHDLVFDPAMTLHEDGYYNSVVYSTASHEGTVRFIDTPIYLWRWNDGSTVRKNRKDFVLRTYAEVMRTRTGICRELKRRGYEDDYVTAVCMTVLNSYYDFQKPSYNVVRNAKHIAAAERAFKRFYAEFGETFRDQENGKIAEIAKAAREIACKNGMLMERQDIKSWLKHIEREVK